MIKIGCCSFDFGPRTLEDALRLIEDLGFRHVDVSAASPGEGAQVDQLAAVTRPNEIADEIRAAASMYELELEEFFITWIFVDGERVDVNHPDPRLRERLIEQFRGLATCAAKAGFESIMGVPGKFQDELGPEGSWQTAIETLRAMQQIAAEQGVQLHVEPHYGSIVQKPKAALELVEEVPGLRYTLDYSHFAAQGISQEEVAPLHEFTGHMHARQGKRGQPQCPLREGEIDFGPIVQKLKDEGWDGVMAMEYVGRAEGPGSEINPVFQNVVMAYRLQRLLAQD